MIELPPEKRKKMRVIETVLSSKNISSGRTVLFQAELKTFIERHLADRITCFCNSTDKINGIMLQSRTVEYDNLDSLLNDIRDVKNIGLVDLKIYPKVKQIGETDKKILIYKSILFNFIAIDEGEYSGFTPCDTLIKEMKRLNEERIEKERLEQEETDSN